MARKLELAVEARRNGRKLVRIGRGTETGMEFARDRAPARLGLLFQNTNAQSRTREFDRCDQAFRAASNNGCVELIHVPLARALLAREVSQAIIFKEAKIRGEKAKRE
jgi:hypothetical protein